MHGNPGMSSFAAAFTDWIDEHACLLTADLLCRTRFCGSLFQPKITGSRISPARPVGVLPVNKV